MHQSKSSHSKNDNKRNSQVRIIGGSLRGRKILFSESEGLRPTLDRIRETVFNWLMTDIHNANCLDLYSGSGALGIEAVSRGAKAVTLVDANKNVCENLKRNAKILSINNIEIINQQAEHFLDNNRDKFDLVFLDPPFEKEMLPSILTKIKHHISKDGLVYVEQENSGEEVQFENDWTVLKSKKTGRFSYSLISQSKDNETKN